MRCYHMRNTLQAYVDGLVPSDIRRRCDEHLADCPHCRALVHRAQRVTDLLMHSELPAVPSGLAERILLRAEMSTRVTPGRNWGWPLLSARVAAVLAIGIAVTVGIVMGWDVGTSHSVAAQSASTSGNPVAVYNLDSLSEAPRGSLMQAYFMLDSPPSRQGI